MDWGGFFLIIYNLFVLPFGNVALAGVFLTVALMFIMGKMGLGFDGALVIGGAFLITFSAVMMPIDLTAMVVIVLMIIFAAGILRAWRK